MPNAGKASLLQFELHSHRPKGCPVKLSSKGQSSKLKKFRMLNNYMQEYIAEEIYKLNKTLALELKATLTLAKSRTTG